MKENHFDFVLTFEWDDDSATRHFVFKKAPKWIYFDSAFNDPYILMRDVRKQPSFAEPIPSKNEAQDNKRGENHSPRKIESIDESRTGKTF